MAQDKVYGFSDSMAKVPVLSKKDTLEQVSIQDLIYDGQDVVETINDNYNLFGHLDDMTEGSKIFSGTSIGNSTAEQYPFTVECNTPEGLTINSNYQNKIRFRGVNANGGSMKSYINDVLSYTTKSTYHIAINSAGAYKCWFTWDLLKEKVVNFKTRVKIHANANVEVAFLGSNNKSDWTNISTMANDQEIDINSVNAYRYYKLEINFIKQYGDANGDVLIYYCYLNVQDNYSYYANKFTIKNDFVGCKNIVALAGNNFNLVNVVKNTINGIPVDRLIQPNSMYNLLFDGEKIVNYSGAYYRKCVSGTLSAGTSVELDEEPKFVVGINTGNYYVLTDKYTVEGKRITADADSNGINYVAFF